MRCKECKEKIADNVKYCPECGALVNDIKYNINTIGNYPVMPQYGRNTSGSQYRTEKNHGSDDTRHLSGKVPSVNKKLIGIGIVLIVIFIYVAVILSSVYDKSETVYDYEAEYDEDYYSDNSAEDTVYHYVGNIYDCDAWQDADVFFSDTALDWYTLFENICNIRSETDAVPVTGYEESDGFVYGIVQERFTALNNSYDAGFVPYYFYIDTSSYVEYTVSGADDHYCDIISEYISAAGLDAQDYIDFDSITRLYEFNVNVSCEDTDCTSLYDIGNCTVVVAEIYGEYKVLYDNVFIEKLLSTL